MNKKCQVFTPENYVKELLDSVGYKKNLYGKKILENSCGDGNILVVIVQRYINDCLRNKFSKGKIVEGLQNDIYGIEIDPEQHQKCINNLNMILNKYEMDGVVWKIYNTDYLRWDDSTQFDFIVGNPPYITYSELKKEEQTYVKTTFQTCKKGKFDYCYAFIEKSIVSLGTNGKMAYLIPGSIFKTVFGKNLRDFMKPYITEIKDYTQETVFDEALVKSSIMVLNKQRKRKVLQYRDMTTREKMSIPVSQLSDKWYFTNEITNGNHRFGDYFKVSHVVATLLNDAYVIKEENCTETPQGYLCNGHNIEREVVKETATPRTLRYNRREKIIFPYKYENGRLIRFQDREFEKRYPGAAAYLRDFKTKLDERKSDTGAQWYEYGRTQALSGLDCEKILISTVVTDDVPAYRLTREYIPYSGMYIVPRVGNHNYVLDDAENILRSDKFRQYVNHVGIRISGNSLRITSRDIEEYRF